jgi:hypothetical protein
VRWHLWGDSGGASPRLTGTGHGGDELRCLQGAAGALATAQLWRGGLRGLEPGFPPRSSFCGREDLIVYFYPMAVAISAVMDVPDIILNAPHE